MKTVRVELGTSSLVTACKLFGKDCVLQIGDWLTPGIAEIPKADLAAFSELVEGEYVRLGFKR
jgi:hypothetical protein